MKNKKILTFFIAMMIAVGGNTAFATDAGQENTSAAISSISENDSAAEAELPAEVDSEEKTVMFRCAYWKYPTGATKELFYKEGNSFKKIPPLFAMSFSNDPVVYKGVLPIKIFRKGRSEQDKGMVFVSPEGEEFTYLFSIDPEEKSDVGAIVFPSLLEDEKHAAVFVFDWSTKTFPYETICFINFSGCDVTGTITPQKKKAATFTIGDGEAFVSEKFPKGRRTNYSVRLDAQDGEKTIALCSTNGSFHSGVREMFFIVPKDGAFPEKGKIPKIEWRSFKDRKPPERR